MVAVLYCLGNTIRNLIRIRTLVDNDGCPFLNYLEHKIGRVQGPTTGPCICGLVCLRATVKEVFLTLHKVHAAVHMNANTLL